MNAHASCEVRRMWLGGPLRVCCAVKTSKTPLAHASGSYVGCYVCCGCGKPSNGVYFVGAVSKWLCGPCKTRAELPGGTK